MTPPTASGPPTAGTAESVMLDGGPLSIGDVVRVSRRGRPVAIGPKAMAAMEASRGVVEAHLADGRAHYGINTGFGSLSRQRIGAGDLVELQRNLIRSHAAGVGEPLADDVVRAMLLALAASLARGCSGVRPLVAQQLVAMLNAGVTPVVPAIGSVGASGDLAPLAHATLVLMGEGEAWSGAGASRRRMDGAAALRSAGLGPLVLEPKEGLALINGTHLMSGQGALLAADFERLFSAASLACAMSIDGCRATDSFLDGRVYAARNQPGAILVAGRLRRLLAGSGIIPSHRTDDPRVQDPYSFRCAPVVLGAAWDCYQYVLGAVHRELGAVTDNPLVFPGGGPGASIVSAGNFHGMPVALPLDALALAIAHVAGISERRTFYLLSGVDGESRLPAFLSPSPGLHSGLMIAQYTAAACCNEIIGLAAPASVANLTTSAGMEDYNSFGPRSAAKARRALELAASVVAIELVCAAEALEHQRPLRSGGAVEKAHSAIRAVVPRLAADRPPAPDIAAMAALVWSGALESTSA
ncbi:MAG: histidine ammonia-lyase [Phycisphaerales bacterium]